MVNVCQCTHSKSKHVTDEYESYCKGGMCECYEYVKATKLDLVVDRVDSHNPKRGDFLLYARALGRDIAVGRGDAQELLEDMIRGAINVKKKGGNWAALELLKAYMALCRE